MSWILCAVSVFTSAAISVDRLLALLLGLRYRHVVTLRRVHVAIICFWLIGALAAWTRMQRIYLAYKGTICIVIFKLFLVTTIFSYTKIHLRLRHQQAQLHNNVPQGQIAIGGEFPLNIAKYKKTISSPGGVGGGTWSMFGYRGAAKGLKSWPCLGQKYSKNPTLCRTTASISRACLGLVTKFTL